MRSRRRLITAAVLCSALVACGDDGEGADATGFDIQRIERDVRADFQAEVTERASLIGSGKAKVEALQCVERSDREARCIATVTGALSGDVPIDVTVGRDGRYIFEARDGSLKPRSEAIDEQLRDAGFPGLDESAGEGAILATARLEPPREGNAERSGVAFIVKQGNENGLLVRARGLAPTSDRVAYGVWFRSSAQDRFLGYIQERVDESGELESVSRLPMSFVGDEFTEMLLTRESEENPESPRNVALGGTLAR